MFQLANFSKEIEKQQNRVKLFVLEQLISLATAHF
jgi:hypothetical protein